MEMITTVPPGGKISTQVPRKIMSLQDIEAGEFQALQLIVLAAFGVVD